MSKVLKGVAAAALAVTLVTPAFAGDAKDMKGNAVKIDEQTGFTYGGDQTAGYAGGKLATGVKDPKVCGTFASPTCSIKYVE